MGRGSRGRRGVVPRAASRRPGQNGQRPLNADAELPAFTYHPDPIGTGSIVRSDRECSSCQRRGPFIYEGPRYGAGPREREICPWCIADGSGAARFGLEFVAGAPTLSMAPSIVDELIHRTPGFFGWQQEEWLVHCGDAAAFLGRTGYADLVDRAPRVLDDMRATAKAHRWNAEETRTFLEALDPDGSPTAYLFRCLHCGTHLGYFDFD